MVDDRRFLPWHRKVAVPVDYASLMQSMMGLVATPLAQAMALHTAVMSQVRTPLND